MNEDSVSGERLDGNSTTASDGAASGGDSGSPDTAAVQETLDSGEGSNDGSGDTLDSPTSSDNGFNPADYPAWYSDPAVNIYLGYSRNDLSQALDGFVQLSDQRELTDEENEQATLALFAWYFLGYGSPDDAVSQSGLLGNIISGITGVGDFSREDIAYTIIYSLYGSPDHWGDAAPFNYLSNVGIAGLLLTIRNDGTTSKNHLYNIYERLGSVISYLSSIRDYSEGNYKRLGGINDTTAQMNERLGSQLGYVSNIKDYSKGAYDRLGTIMDALHSNGLTEAAYSEGIYKRLGTIMDALYQNGTTEAAYSEGIYKRLGTVMDLLTRIADKDYSASLDADLTPVTDRLDEIARLLSPSGQSSLLDSFLGDFTMPVSSALSAQVQAAMQSAFPFCIPAILKQVLGLMEVDPSAASVEFDILGATCTLDLSAGGFASGIATVTSWLCRILFALVLIVSTPRFVFALPGRGS